jgi:hypothetical protein
MQNIFLNQTVSSQISKDKFFIDRYNLQGIKDYERVSIRVDSTNLNGKLELIETTTGQLIVQTSNSGGNQNLIINFTALPNTKYVIQVSSQESNNPSSYVLKTESSGITMGNDVPPSPTIPPATSTVVTPIETGAIPTPVAPIGTGIPPAPVAPIGTGTTPAPVAPIGTGTTPAPVAPIGTGTTPAPSTVVTPTGTVTPAPSTATNTTTGTIAVGVNNLLTIQNGDANIQFTPGVSRAKFRNEMGVFLVDDDQGRINGILPGQAGYLAAAMNRAQVISSNGDPNSIANSSRQLTFPSSSRLGFYLVQDGTTAEIRADLATGKAPRSPVFFQSGNSDGEHLRVTQTGNKFQFAWEDTLGGGDRDFNDLLISAGVTTTPQSKVAALQGQQPVIDLRDITGVQSTAMLVSGSANYDNFIGFYVVDDPTGRIGNLTPESVGYAQAALNRSVASYSKSAGLVFSSVNGGSLLVPYMIANGTVASFLTQNPNNQAVTNLPVAYFGYVGANPDRISHVRSLRDNQFAFEDVLGGGDRDFNDAIVQVKFLG